VFNETGPTAVRRRLTDYLASAAEDGFVNCADPGHAASLLLGALIADLQLRSLLGFAPPGDELTCHVAEAVAMFIARYGTDHPGLPPNGNPTRGLGARRRSARL
jgi:hypothetical protein